MSGSPTVAGSRLALSVYTPDATNVVRSVVAVDVIQDELVLNSKTCSPLGIGSGLVEYALEFAGTATAAPGDKIKIQNAGGPGATMNCVGWTPVDGTSCIRSPGDTLTTQWTFRLVFSREGGCNSSTTGFAWIDLDQNGNAMVQAPAPYTCSAGACPVP
jgi:hypothetical protein